MLAATFDPRPVFNRFRRAPCWLSSGFTTPGQYTAEMMPKTSAKVIRTGTGSMNVPRYATILV